jgi:hypothetical protein
MSRNLNAILLACVLTTGSFAMKMKPTAEPIVHRLRGLKRSF